MKFACPKCQTRYSIADSKVPSGKTLRFTCKKCEHTFRLKRKGKEVQADPTGPVPLQSKDMLEGAEATRVANLDEILDLKRRAKSGGVPPVGPTPFEAEEWFVLVAGKQSGPFSHGTIESMLREHKVDGRTYAWRDGMGDWKRLNTIPEFATLAAEAGAEARARPKTGALPPPPKKPVKADAQSVFEQATTSMSTKQLQAELAKLDERGQLEEQAPPELSEEPTGERLRRETDDAPFFPEESPVEMALAATSPGLRGPLAAEQNNPDYLHGAPGEATRVFMATAGIYKRRRMQKIAAVVAGVVVASLATVITLDLTGVFTIPALGAVYDYTGIEDPDAARAVARTEARLQDADLSPEERAELEKRRAAMRARLLGTDGGEKKAKVARATNAGAGNAGAAQETGIEEAKDVSQQEHDLTAMIMGDKRKQSKGPTLSTPSELQTPNLPAGLTRDAIFEVINQNQRAMSLCITQSMKAGEKLQGRMEVEMQIAANGSVRNASITTAQFNNSTIGKCTVKTVKRWKFPRFNGEPVTVIFPYVLSASF